MSSNHLAIYQVVVHSQRSKRNPTGYVTVYSILGPCDADIPALLTAYKQERRAGGKAAGSADFLNWLRATHHFIGAVHAGTLDFKTGAYEEGYRCPQEQL